jgi:hypothetical protein
MPCLHLGENILDYQRQKALIKFEQLQKLWIILLKQTSDFSQRFLFRLPQRLKKRFLADLGSGHLS